jgi:hypothetical protein
LPVALTSAPAGRLLDGEELLNRVDVKEFS